MTATLNIKQKTYKSAAYLLGGQATNQVLRLLGNLILTRLLAPELFGIMAITSVVIASLSLFSDIGTGPAVIRSNRGLESSFLNTVWTLQILRGVLLFLATSLLAYPVSLFYQQPLLALVLPVSGVSLLLSGTRSMAIATLNKSLKMDKIVIMSTTSYVIGLLAMIVLAYHFKNIWALVLGGLVAPFIETIWSYRLDTTLRHRLTIDRSVTGEIIAFGKWIFVSTAVMFLATQADRLFLGKFLPIALFGVYNIALTLAEAPKALINTISGQIIFPLIALYKDLAREELRNKILKRRQLLLLIVAIPLALFSGFGDMIIAFLYDDRYQEAGWMLPLLAFGMWPLILYSTVDRCLFVIDNPKYPAIANFTKLIFVVIFLPIAYSAGGKFGAVLIVALNDIPAYAVISLGLFRKKLSFLRQDMWSTLIFAMMMAIIIAIRLSFGWGLPGEHMFISA